MKILVRLDDKSRLISTRHIQANTDYRVTYLGAGAIKLEPYQELNQEEQ